MNDRRSLIVGAAGMVMGLAAAGCGSRSSFWNVDVGGTTSVGLANGVALVDDADHQVVILTAASLASGPPALAIPVGHNIAKAVASADGSTLFVLATGDAQPATAAGEGQPSLTTIHIDPGTLKLSTTQYPMLQACQSLAVDPAGEWAVAYQPTGFVQNENELVIFDLTGAHATPVTHTLQSLGGTPQQLAFTPPLLVNPALGPQGGGDRHLLVVLTQIDLSLLDLDHAFDTPLRPEITIPLTSGTGGQQVTPAGVAVDGFDSTSASDAQIALRTDSSDVFTFTFGPPDPGDVNDFKPIPNETPVGGTPTDMAFVHDDLGNVGLAVLVPSIGSAVLVQPATSTTSTVTLPSPYSNLSLVTSAVSTTSNGDVALLWNGSTGSSGVALWTVGQPFFSIDVPGVSAPIQTVLDVPSSSMKVLEPSDGSGFFVLDLESERVTPLNTTSRAALSISPDGQRVWAFAAGGTDLSCIDLDDFSPINLRTTAPVDAVYDIGGAGGARDLVALDMEATIGATVFDALNPKGPPRRFPALLLPELAEGP